jgi:hypothetical protein
MKTKLEFIIDCQDRLVEIQQHLNDLLDQLIEKNTISFAEMLGVCTDINLHINYIRDFIKNEHVVLDPTQKTLEQKILDIELPKKQVQIDTDC